MDIFNHLFDNFTQFELNQWSIEELQKKITFTLCSIQILANCPKCDQLTNRIHSCYERTLSDLH